MLIFHVGTILGFIASIIAAIVESVGNYSNIARVSDETLPPLSAVNRAILVEGWRNMIKFIDNFYKFEHSELNHYFEIFM